VPSSLAVTHSEARPHIPRTLNHSSLRTTGKAIRDTHMGTRSVSGMTRFYRVLIHTASLSQLHTVVLTLLKTVILHVLAYKPTNCYPRLDRGSINLGLWVTPYSSTWQVFAALARIPDQDQIWQQVLSRSASRCSTPATYCCPTSVTDGCSTCTRI
jgi:hypothetical protein